MGDDHVHSRAGAAGGRWRPAACVRGCDDDVDDATVVLAPRRTPVGMTAADAIAALIHAYAERLDGGDLDGVAALFADATYGRAGGPLRRGSAEVRAALAIVKLHDGSPRTKHVITNLVVDVDEAAGTASARSYFTVFQATEALSLQAIIAGRYVDRFERAGGGWRFHARVIHVDLVGDLREHLHRAGGAVG